MTQKVNSLFVTGRTKLDLQIIEVLMANFEMLKSYLKAYLCFQLNLELIRIDCTILLSDLLLICVRITCFKIQIRFDGKVK